MVIGCSLIGLSLTSCSLDEQSYTQLDQELVYTRNLSTPATKVMRVWSTHATKTSITFMANSTE